jgi:hypothetical protein
MGKLFPFVFGGPLSRIIFIMHKVCGLIFCLMQKEKHGWKYVQINEKIAPIHYVR